MKLRICVSQFPVSHDIDSNFNFISKHIREAAGRNCNIIQFPECALSGYAGVNFQSFSGFDWEVLDRYTQRIQHLAKELGLRILLGSSHLSEQFTKPYNSLYFIDKSGEVKERYDKRFCAGGSEGGLDDLKHYRPGDHFSVFKIKGIICSMLVCHDYRYPELYRELARREIQLVFHSFNAGNISSARYNQMKFPFARNHDLNISDSIPTQTMVASMISYAANNYMFISCCNTSARESCWGSFVVRPDGFITDSLERNKPGILVSEINLEEQFYDSTKAWRKNALNGILNSSN